MKQKKILPTETVWCESLRRDVGISSANFHLEYYRKHLRVCEFSLSHDSLSEYDQSLVKMEIVKVKEVLADLETELSNLEEKDRDENREIELIIPSHIYPDGSSDVHFESYPRFSRLKFDTIKKK